MELSAILLLICSIVANLFGAQAESKAEYMQRRHFLQNDEKQRRTGGTLDLTPQEETVNELLMHVKHEETFKAFMNGSIFPPAKHFFKAKPYIEKSRVFRLLRNMPKGMYTIY